MATGPTGIVQIGGWNGIHAQLSAKNTTGLEATIAECISDGTSFTLRFFNASTREVLSTVIGPHTPVTFRYHLGESSTEEIQETTQEHLAAIRDGGSLNIESLEFRFPQN